MQNNLMSFTKLQFKRLIVPTILTTILAFINGPMALILAKDDPYRILNKFMYFSYVNKFFVYAGIFILPLLYTRMLYDYLFDEKIADFNLSLPVSRKTQYISGFLATSLATIIPVVLNLLFTMILYTTKTIPLPTSYVAGVTAGHIFIEIFVMIIVIMIVTATCSFVAGFMGTRLEHFFYSAAVLILPAAIVAILQFSIPLYIYGVDQMPSLENWLYLSPVASMFNYAFEWQSIQLSTPFLISPLNKSLMRIGICAVIALILFIWGLKIAKQRKGEHSGRKGSRNIVSFVVDIVLSYGVGIIIASFFMSIMNLDTPNSLFILMTAFFSILIYIIDHFITTQNIKNIKKNVSSLVVLLLISVFTFTFYITNGFGYEKRLPDVDNIEQITMNYDGYIRKYNSYAAKKMTGKEIEGTIAEPQYIEEIRNFHLKALEERPSPSDYVRIKYTTNNGKEINRFFEPSITDALEIYKNLHNSEEFNRSSFVPFYLDSDSFERIGLNTFKNFYSSKEITLTKQQREKLLDTFRKDILTNINSESVMEKGVHIGILDFTQEIKDELENTSEVVTISEYLRSDYTDTIALLKEFGLSFPEGNQNNINLIEFEYPDPDPEGNITFDKSVGLRQIPQKDITPEMLEDIFDVAYPTDHFISSLGRNSMVDLYVSYWNKVDETPFNQDYCIQKADMDTIIAKYNLK